VATNYEADCKSKLLSGLSNRFNARKQASYPLPKNLLPHDMEVPPQLGPAQN
jgi:hypothetical protein